MIKTVKIWDMDGTIVDSLHRYRTIINANGKEVIDLAFWRANEPKAYDDSLLPLAAQYQDDLKNPEIYNVIATARVLNAPDMAFIQDKLGMPNKIISRPNGSDISGGLLKVKGLQKIRNLKQFKNAEWVFFEDNKDYLKRVCDTLNIKGVFVPSLQGH